MSMSFFFSSRRRHTRSLRDWSSDVCSSDLEPRELALGRLEGLLGQLRRLDLLAQFVRFGLLLVPLPQLLRSEERRVGKSRDFGWRRLIQKNLSWSVIPLIDMVSWLLSKKSE